MTIKEIIMEKDPAMGAASRMAELVDGGCDYDDIAEKLAQAYAEWCGLEEPNDEVYEVANELLNKELEGYEMTLAQVLASEEMIAQVKVQMIGRWDGLVKSGEIALGEMIESLDNQVHGGCQGWDASTEEYEGLAEENGWEIEGAFDTDEHVDKWLEIVQDTAREWLRRPLNAWGAYMLCNGFPYESLNERAIMEFARNEVFCGMNGVNTGEITKEMTNWVLLCSMKGMVLDNLREHAHGAWKNGDITTSDNMNALADKLESGNAEGRDWLEAVDYCRM